MTDNEMLNQDMAQAVPVAAPQEKMIPQSEVNHLVGKVRQEAHEKGKMEAQQVQQGTLSEERIRQIIMEQTQQSQQKQAMEMRAQQIVQDFAGKMSAGGAKYPGFEEKVAALDLPKIPQIVHLASSVDNTADVMNELADNPHKIASLLTLARETPHLANLEMQKLSNSIKANQKATETVQTKEPLSTIKPSTAPSDKGPLSVADFRKAKWAQR